MLPESAVSQYAQRPESAPYQPASAGAGDQQLLRRRVGGQFGRRHRGRQRDERHGKRDRAQGQRNLSNSAAAINLTQARKNEIQNRQQWTNTYFDMRNTQRQQMAAKARPRSTPEQLARIAKNGTPDPLAPNQMDPVTGRLYRPSALQQDGFAPQRQVVDQAFVLLSRYGAIDYSNQMQTRAAIKDMFNQLKAQIDQVPQQDYVTCRSFLQRLLYTSTGTSSLS